MPVATPVPGRAAASRPADPVFRAIVAVAVAVRIVLILRPDGQLGFAEHIAMFKSWAFWNWGRPGLDLDPHTAGWPGLSFYLAFASQALFRLAGSVAGVFRAPGDFQAAFYLHREWFVTAGQLAWTALYGFGMMAVFEWTRLAAGRAVALVALAGFALDPLVLEESLTLGPDLPALVFLWASAWRLLRYDVDGAPSDARRAAIFCGLGISAKYYPALIVPLALWVLVRRASRDGRPFPSRLLLECAGLLVAAFLLTSPMFVRDWAVTQRDFGDQTSALSSEHFGQAWHGPSILYYLTSVLPGNFGWVALAAAVAGLIGLARARAAARPGLLMGILCLGLFGSLQAIFPRYILGLVPALWAGAAWLAVEGARALRPRGVPAWAAPAVLLGLWLAFTSGPELALLLRADSRAVALREMKALAQPGMAILRERYTPELASLADSDRLHRLLEAGRLSRRWAAEVRALPAPREINMYLSTVHPEISDAWYDARHIEPFDAVLVSTGVSTRYLAEPARFPRQVAFYRHLERFARRQATWGGGRMSGPVIDLYVPDTSRFRDLEASWAAESPGFPVPRGLSVLKEESVFQSELAMLFMQRGRMDAAQTHLERAIRADSANAEACNNLALVYAQQGRNADAEPLLGRSLALDPRNSNTELNLVAVQVALGRYDELLTHIRNLKNSRTIPTQALYELGSQLEQDQRPIEASAAYQSALEREPSPGGYMALGRVQESAGYLEGALDSYSKAIRGGAGEEARARFEALIARVDAPTRARFSGVRSGGAGR